MLTLDKHWIFLIKWDVNLLSCIKSLPNHLRYNSWKGIYISSAELFSTEHFLLNQKIIDAQFDFLFWLLPFTKPYMFYSVSLQLIGNQWIIITTPLVVSIIIPQSKGYILGQRKLVETNIRKLRPAK